MLSIDGTFKSVTSELPDISTQNTTIFFQKGHKRLLCGEKVICSQYKDEAIQLKNFLILNLPPFFVTYIVKEKKAAISNLKSFSTE